MIRFRCYNISSLHDLDLASEVISVWREQFKLLAEKYYPDGKNYVSYMYLVVRKRARV